MAKQKKKNKMAKRFFGTFLINASILLSLLFFSPVEIFAGNILEFHFRIGDVWWLLLLIAVAAALIFAAIEVLLIPKKVLRGINLFFAGTDICIFLQSIFLNGNMASLTGESASYPKSVIIVNLIIWAAVYAVIFTVYYGFGRKIGLKKIYNWVLYVCAVLIFIQSVGLISVFVGMDKTADGSKDSVLTSEGEFTLSGGKNVVYFIIDTCDGDFVNSSLAKYPDLFEGLDGFTYYPNATSTHSRTYPAVPYLLTGEMCHFDVPCAEYLGSAYKKSEFLEDVDASGTDTRLFTESVFVSGGEIENVDNLLNDESGNVYALNRWGLVMKSLKISLYKGAPYILKPLFFYSGEEINAGTVDCTVTEYTPAIAENDIAFYKALTENGLTVSDEYKKAFRFYHLYGTHPGAEIDENVNRASNPDYADVVCGNIKIIKDYIGKMKEAGVYEDSTVIITADHGSSGGGDSLDLPSAPTLIMLVKPAGASGTPCKTSDAPVCQGDLFATVIDGLGGNYSKYGKRITDYAEDEERDRYYYYSALYSDIDGEVALREYLIDGDARAKENWKPTGNYWDINYSKNTVSDKRFTGK